MKIIAKREAILSPLQAVIGVVERRQTMPILANVLLSARGGRLSVTATDLEVELVAASEVDVQRNGEVTVPGRKLLDICRALPEGVEMTLNLEGERMTVRAKKSRFTLSTLPATEFPTVDEINAQQTLKLPQKDFKKLLEKTHFSMAQQDVRYYLNAENLASRSSCHAKACSSCSAFWATKSKHLKWRSAATTFAFRSATFASLRS
jgi:DNA polymerase-3 subunit beta